VIIPSTDFEVPSIAAVVHDRRSASIDLMMREVADRLRASGRRLAGLVQHNVEKDGSECSEMLLKDLASDRLVSISMQRPRGSRGCRLDAAGLAEAAALAAAGIGRGADLVVISKFGAQEASGKGLRDEIALAVGSGIPLLTCVSRRLLPTWRDFIGEAWTALPPDPTEILEWAHLAIGARAREPALGA
jgi:nucleoside-triphosphatase THEP1